MRVPIKFKGRESVNSGLNYMEWITRLSLDLNLAMKINYRGFCIMVRLIASYMQVQE